VTPEEFATFVDSIGEKLQTMDYQPGLQLVKPIVRKKFNQNFLSSSTADGNKWPPRVPVIPPKTHPLLILSGLMKNSIVEGTGGGFEDQGPNHLSLGIDGGAVPYATTQQEGSAYKRIPARPFAEIDDKTADEATEVFADWLFQELFGA